MREPNQNVNWPFSLFLRQSGLLLLREPLRSVVHAKAQSQPPFLDFDSFTVEIAEAVFCLSKLYEDRLDDGDDVTFRYALEGVKGLPLGSSRRDRYGRCFGSTCRIETVAYAKTRKLVDWRAGLLDHALEICQQVFERFNVAESPMIVTKEHIQKTLARAL